MLGCEVSVDQNNSTNHHHHHHNGDDHHDGDEDVHICHISVFGCFVVYFALKARLEKNMKRNRNKDHINFVTNSQKERKGNWGTSN